MALYIHVIKSRRPINTSQKDGTSVHSAQCYVTHPIKRVKRIPSTRLPLVTCHQIHSYKRKQHNVVEYTVYITIKHVYILSTIKIQFVT